MSWNIEIKLDGRSRFRTEAGTFSGVLKLQEPTQFAIPQMLTGSFAFGLTGFSYSVRGVNGQLRCDIVAIPEQHYPPDRLSIAFAFWKSGPALIVLRPTGQTYSIAKVMRGCEQGYQIMPPAYLYPKSSYQLPLHTLASLEHGPSLLWTREPQSIAPNPPVIDLMVPIPPSGRLTGYEPSPFIDNSALTLRPACSVRFPDEPIAPAITPSNSGMVQLMPEVINALGERELSRMVHDSGDRESSPIGWTKFTFTRTIDYEAGTRPAAFGGGFCVSSRPGSWSVPLRAKAQIHIAREVLKGTCPFRLTLAHEQKHVRATGDLLRKYAARLAKALADAGMPTRAQEWWSASNSGDLDTEIASIAEPIWADFKRDKIKSDREIDAVNEDSACPKSDWDAIETRYNMGGRR